jgi:outer membrane lipoprotein SlyB
MKKICVILTAAIMLLTSCAQLQQGDNTALGTGIGAITGAIIGQALGGSTEATVIGGAVGAVLGYAVITHVQSQTTQTYNSEQTKAMIPAKERQKPVLEIRDKSIAPSKTVRAGEQVTVQVSYLLYDEGTKETPIRETKTVWHNGKQIFKLDESEEVRNNGTYNSICTFELPSEIEKGDYELRYNVNTKFVSKDSFVPFTVI